MYRSDMQNALSTCTRTTAGLSRFTAFLQEMSELRSDDLYDHRAADIDLGTKQCIYCGYVCTRCQKKLSFRTAFGGNLRIGSLFCDSESISAAYTATWNANHHCPGHIGQKIKQSSSSDNHGGVQPFLVDKDPDADSDLAVSDANHLNLPAYMSEEADFGAAAGEYRTDAICEDTVHVPRAINDHDAIRGKEVDDHEEDDYGSFKVDANSSIHTHGEFNFQERRFLNAKKLLYTLRRNPNPSKRLVDRELALMASLDQRQQTLAPCLLPAAGAAVLQRKSSYSEKFNNACTECGKEFPSSKALFGHMRCHPEREWRGIQRPMSLHREKIVTCSRKNAAPSISTEVSDHLHEKESAHKRLSQAGNGSLNENSDAESIEVAYMKGGEGGERMGIQSWTTGKRSKRSRQMVRSLQEMTGKALGTSFSNSSSEIKEDADMATCLVMLASASRDQKELPQVKKLRRTESLLSSDCDRRSHSDDTMREIYPVKEHNWRTSKHPHHFKTKPLNFAEDDSSCFFEGMDEERAMDLLEAGKPRYECAKCKRIFKSHQALGGHRASHKRVKGCFAKAQYDASDGGSTLDFPESPELEDITDVDLPRYYSDDEEDLLTAISGSKTDSQICIGDEKEGINRYNDKRHSMSGSNNGRVKGPHECNICHRVFDSGQALGEYKRCHWGGAGMSEATSNTAPVGNSQQTLTSEISLVENSQQQQEAPAERFGLQRTGRDELLDLNLPAPEQEQEDYYIDSRHSSSTSQVNLLATKSIFDEDNILTVPKSPSEWISSVKVESRIVQKLPYLFSPRDKKIKLKLFGHSSSKI